MAVRVCEVSFRDARGIRHGVEVEEESVFEAAVLGVKRLREDPWIEVVSASTVLDVQVKEPTTTHSISLEQVERWLASATTNPIEASKKAKLKLILVQG